MAASLIFEDYNSTFKVEYKTNLLNATDDNFTVCEVVGLSDTEKRLGMAFERLQYTVAAFKAFALSKGLKLSKLDGSGLTVLQGFAGSNYYSGGLGIDNL